MLEKKDSVKKIRNYSLHEVSNYIHHVDFNVKFTH